MNDALIFYIFIISILVRIWYLFFDKMKLKVLYIEEDIFCR
ncbi:hypothetical protein MTBBW1_60051 [Desulfamplus magnetovallimortis]|uniref:Uncharacterized protein n=1 Tax=Desulfamplus magnetovallimortis TaxID=1246637 RepID=A0A1W1HI25_9BACT|nr:hypothetical protein MTBBW1_60051 [Desulfamplus magnetovallimortis]